jgi:hypothetical protein
MLVQGVQTNLAKHSTIVLNRPCVGMLRKAVNPIPVSGELLGGSPISPVIVFAELRKWAESHFRDAPRGSETMGAAKHAAMEKLRVISWKFCRG